MQSERRRSSVMKLIIATSTLALAMKGQAIQAESIDDTSSPVQLLSDDDSVWSFNIGYGDVNQEDSLFDNYPTQGLINRDSLESNSEPKYNPNNKISSIVSHGNYRDSIDIYDEIFLHKETENTKFKPRESKKSSIKNKYFSESTDDGLNEINISRRTWSWICSMRRSNDEGCGRRSAGFGHGSNKSGSDEDGPNEESSEVAAESNEATVESGRDVTAKSGLKDHLRRPCIPGSKLCNGVCYDPTLRNCIGESLQ